MPCYHQEAEIPQYLDSLPIQEKFVIWKFFFGGGKVAEGGQFQNNYLKNENCLANFPQHLKTNCL